MSSIRVILLTLLLALAVPAVATAQVDINTADAKSLAMAMTGVGLVKAEAIVAYRDRNGPFKSIDDLARVKGIGAKTVEANRSSVVIVDRSGGAYHLRGGGGKPYAAQ
jgi:competence protein ComEA